MTDRWAALQLDQAVALVGLAIENAAQEMTNVGDEQHPQYRPKYRLSELLDPAFRLPGEEEQIGLPLHAEGLQFDEVS